MYLCFYIVVENSMIVIPCVVGDEGRMWPTFWQFLISYHRYHIHTHRYTHVYAHSQTLKTWSMDSSKKTGLAQTAFNLMKANKCIWTFLTLFLISGNRTINLFFSNSKIWKSCFITSFLTPVPEVSLRAIKFISKLPYVPFSSH